MRNRIQINNLPTQSLQAKARLILSNLAQGISYTCFRGKRFRWDRQYISIPLGRNYRIICREIAGKIQPLALMTHERYNRFCHGKVRV